jgi:hypothetical protein
MSAPPEKPMPPTVTFECEEKAYEITLRKYGNNVVLNVWAKRLDGNHVCFAGRQLLPTELEQIGMSLLSGIHKSHIHVQINVVIGGLGLAIVAAPVFEK